MNRTIPLKQLTSSSSRTRNPFAPMLPFFRGFSLRLESFVPSWNYHQEDASRFKPQGCGRVDETTFVSFVTDESTVTRPRISLRCSRCRFVILFHYQHPFVIVFLRWDRITKLRLNPRYIPVVLTCAFVFIILMDLLYRVAAWFLLPKRRGRPNAMSCGQVDRIFFLL